MDMTNDDLTPEEREALAGLPRERTPSAGLEDRVVAAMRERGHLARKPARVIRISNTRGAGLLAACVVLMIGAYSIGLNRGVNREVLGKVEPQGRSAPKPSSEPAREEIGLKSPDKEQPRRQDVATSNEVDKGLIEKSAPAFEPKLNVQQLATPKDAKKEKSAKADEVTEAMTRSFSDRLSENAKPAPATDLASPAAPPMAAQRRTDMSDAMSTSGPRTFALNGGTLIVDAPDSVRVVTDAQGRTLLIYTSQGVIRIRLAD
jgi:hypothetical protein